MQASHPARRAFVQHRDWVHPPALGLAKEADLSLLKWNKTTSGPAPFGSTSQGQVETLTVTEQSPADAERCHRPCDNPAVPPLTVPLEQASKDLAHRPGGSHSSLGKPLRHFVLTGLKHNCLILLMMKLGS